MSLLAPKGYTSIELPQIQDQGYGHNCMTHIPLMMNTPGEGDPAKIGELEGLLMGEVETAVGKGVGLAVDSLSSLVPAIGPLLGSLVQDAIGDLFKGDEAYEGERRNREYHGLFLDYNKRITAGDLSPLSPEGLDWAYNRYYCKIMQDNKYWPYYGKNLVLEMQAYHVLVLNHFNVEPYTRRRSGKKDSGAESIPTTLATWLPWIAGGAGLLGLTYWLSRPKPRRRRRRS